MGFLLAIGCIIYSMWQTDRYDANDCFYILLLGVVFAVAVAIVLGMAGYGLLTVLALSCAIVIIQTHPR